ncbi:MAG TPA: protein kinase [Kofleriaceae bacterium]
MSVNDPPSEPPSATEEHLSDGTFGRMLRAVATVPGSAGSAVGKTFGRYRIIGELGRGGMGVVYEAVDAELNRHVALKLLPGELVDAQRRALFLSEVLVTAGLEHPGIVPVYDAGETPDGNLFYAMRKVSGRTLAALIAEAPAIAERMALLPHLIACANAVAYAHDVGIIHRDLKPANVVVGAFGETVVVDWGIATRVDAGPAGEAAAASPQAQRLGTPAYMAPEQASGAELGPRTDVFALGAMLYHLLDGRPPPRTGAGFDPRSDLEPELIAVMRKAMAPDPADRYPSLRELAEELRRFQAGQLVGAHRYSLDTLLWRWVRRHRSKVITAGVLAVAIAVASFATIRAIVHGRDAAEAARQVAERAQASAETRNRELLLLHARSEVPHDPTAALAWLKRSPHARADAPEEQQIATEAWARGVARYVLRGPAAFSDAVVAAGGRVVAASLTDRVLWWDDMTGPPHLLRASDGIGRSIEITADGRTLVSTDGAGAVRVWNLATGDSRRLAIRAAVIVLAPRGDRALLVHPVDGLHLFTLPDLAQVALDKDVEGAAFVDDGAHLAVARPGTVDVIDRAGRVVRAYARTSPHATVIAGSSDGRWVGVATRNGVDVVDRATGAWLRFATDEVAATSLRFSPDGRWAATCGAQAGSWLLDLRGHKATLLTRNERCFSNMAFSPDGGTLFTVGYDDNIHVWDVTTGLYRSLRGQQGSTSALMLSPDASWLVTTGSDATVRLFALDTRQTRLVRDAQAISRIAATGSFLTRETEPATFSIRSVDGATEPLAHVAYGELPEDNAFGALSRDGRIACWLDARGAIVVVERATGRRSSFGPYPDEKITAVELSATGALLATATDHGVIRSTVIATAATRVLGHHDHQAIVVRYSLDERQLASGGRDSKLRIWDLETGASTVIADHTARVWDVAFSPDGSWLASASADGTARSFRRDGRPLQVLRGHVGPVLSVDIAPTGAELLTTGIDGTIRRWSAQTGHGLVIRWFPMPVFSGLYSVDGTRYTVSHRDGFYLTDPSDPVVPQDRLAGWLEATTSATVDDAGHLGGPPVPGPP